MSQGDKTKAVLQDALAELFRQQSAKSGIMLRDSYLIAQNQQYLGRITKNRYDSLSILNKYGPHGSKYSQVSIFNEYSPYGGKYGAYSVNNPHCIRPPRLILGSCFSKYVTVNARIKDRIDPAVFISLLEENIDALLRGDFEAAVPSSHYPSSELYVKAADGVFLGSLTTNQFDPKSIFNQFGDHGSQFGIASIFNQFGSYGGQFSSYSPYNQFTSTPPVVMRGDQAVGYLTKNKFLTPRIDPDTIKAFAIKNA